MLEKKIVIVLCISIFSVSWIQSIPDGKETEILPFPGDSARWFEKKLWEALADDNRSVNDSVSRSTISTINNSFSDSGSGEDDPFTDDGSGLPASTLEDDFFKLTSPLPVTTTNDFTFEKPALISVEIKDAPKENGKVGQHSSSEIITVVSFCTLILMLIVLIVIRTYCFYYKVRQEEHAAREPLVQFSKITTE